MNCAAWSSDKKHIVSGGDDAQVLVWDVATGKQVMEPLKGHTKSVLHVILNAKTTVLISASLDMTIIVWDLWEFSEAHAHASFVCPTRKTATVRYRLQVDAHYVDSVSLSPDERFLVCGNAPNIVQMWNINTGQKIRVMMGLERPSVEGLVWSSDGQHIESVISESETVHVRKFVSESETVHVRKLSARVRLCTCASCQRE